MKRFFKSVLFSLAAVALVLAAAEALCRAGLDAYIRVRYVPMMVSDSEARLRRDSTLGWLPEGEEPFRGKPGVTKAKPADVFRIIALGDSCTRGVGVRPEETFSARLEQDFSSKAAPLRVEVLNAGVNGYKTEQDADYLETELLPYSPDLVIVYANAFDTSDAAIDADKTLAELKQDRVRRPSSRLRSVSTAQDFLYRFKSYYLLKKVILPLRDRTPDQRDLGPDLPLKRSANFMRMRLLCEMIGADFMIVEAVTKGRSPSGSFLWVPDWNAARRWEGEFVPVGRPMIESGDGADELIIDDVHPTPRGHAFIAERIKNRIIVMNLIETAARKRSDIRYN